MSTKKEHSIPASNVIRLAVNNGSAKRPPNTTNKNESLAIQMHYISQMIDDLPNESIKQALNDTWQAQVMKHFVAPYFGGAL